MDLDRIAKMYYAGFIILDSCLVILMNSGKYLTTMKTPTVHKASHEHGNALQTTCESARFASVRFEGSIPFRSTNKEITSVKTGVIFLLTTEIPQTGFRKFWAAGCYFGPPSYSLDIAPQPLLCVRLSKHEATGRFSVHGKREKGTLTDRRSVTALIPIETVLLFQ